MTNDPALKQLTGGHLDKQILKAELSLVLMFLDQGGDIHNTSQAKDLFNTICPQ